MSIWKLILRYPKAFATAIGLHLLLAIFFVVSFDWTSKPDAPEPEVDVVQATAVDESQVQAELAKLREIEARKRKKEEDRVKRLESKADRAKRERQKEQKRIAELEKQRKAESEKKRKAEQERKQAEAERKLAQEKADEAKKAREQLEAERAKAEADRKLAEEKARKAKEEAERVERERRLAEEERMRQEMLEAEANRLREQREKQVASVIQRYQFMIKEKVERHWTRPATAKTGMSCDVKVRIIPGGNVLSVRITKSSGDGVFDRSVENAVRRAAPLPLPEDATLFKHFRELDFNFKPS